MRSRAVADRGGAVAAGVCAGVASEVIVWVFRMPRAPRRGCALRDWHCILMRLYYSTAVMPISTDIALHLCKEGQ